MLERKDSCALVAISLSTASRTRARIWVASGLPIDAHTLSAVPSGGCLVACMDLLLYHTQVCCLGNAVVPSSRESKKMQQIWVTRVHTSLLLHLLAV